MAVRVPDSHLSTTAIFFRPSGQKLHTLTLVLNLCTMAASLHGPLSSVPNVAVVVERTSTVFSRFPKLQVKLLEIFSEFGLVYEVQVIDSSDYSEGKGSIESLVHDQPTEPSLWM